MDIGKNTALPARPASHDPAVTCQKGSAPITDRTFQHQRQETLTRRARLSAHGRLIRVENCVLAGALTAIGGSTAVVVSDRSTGRLLLACAIVGLVVAAGNAINDYFDRHIDALRRPGRPLPSGALKPRVAVLVAAVASAMAIALSMPLESHASLFVALMVTLAVAYSAKLKGRPLIGNVAVAAQCAFTIFFGCAAVGRFTPMTWHIATVVFLGILAFEIAKTIEDEIGDNFVGNLRTVAHVLSPRGQRAVLLLLAILALAASLVPIPTHGELASRVLILTPMVPLSVAAVWRRDLALSLVVTPFIAVSKLAWILALAGMAVLPR
jgi:geranylgeranylglycerol-phosphate geranylgeranyltransferase